MTHLPCSRLQHVMADLQPLRSRLTDHPLYASIETVGDLHLFMEHHVFAVFDFMSLLKALQRRLTCLTIPWRPRGDPRLRRLINEIVLAEESDEVDGRALSHFELYLEAMEQAGAATTAIRRLLDLLGAGRQLSAALQETSVPRPARLFVEETMALIQDGDTPAIAAAFLLGREDVIPPMFRRLVDELDRQRPGHFALLRLYMERHIQLDGDLHSHLAARMLDLLCGEDEILWRTVRQAAGGALESRLALWDGVLGAIRGRQPRLASSGVKY